ncbi:MAG TPA: FkbM family methyltransferase [Aggregatilineales bacterium]|nr:FkbM family methyltransferase [Aggregatilineales bacterium]
MLLSRLWYYLSSIPTLLVGVKNWPTVVGGLLRRQPFTLELRTGLSYEVRSLMDVWIIKETCLDRDYETHGIPLQDGWTVVDIGAGLGDFSVYAAKKLPHSTLYAYEPFPESFALLQDNIERNVVQNVKAYPVAIGGAAETLGMDTATGVPVRHAALQASETAGALTVKAVTLDEAMQEIGQCDFLKMDCEGGEYDILFHASDQALAHIRHISMEYHDNMTPYTHDDLAKFLDSHGFQVKLTPNPAHREIGFLYASHKGQ